MTMMTITTTMTYEIAWFSFYFSNHLWGQTFDSHKWPTVLVDETKGKPSIFKACLCGSLYMFVTFTTSFYPCVLYNKRLQTLFTDQLDQRIHLKEHTALDRSSWSLKPFVLKCIWVERSRKTRIQ